MICIANLTDTFNNTIAYFKIMCYTSNSMCMPFNLVSEISSFRLHILTAYTKNVSP